MEARDANPAEKKANARQARTGSGLPGRRQFLPERRVCGLRRTRFPEAE
ncbi:hypothetical protein [Cupriavidus taiwanensis]